MFGMMGPSIAGPGGMFRSAARGTQAGGETVQRTEVADTEAKLGFAFRLRFANIYLEVANGGSGPRWNLQPQAAHQKWREFTLEPIGPRGRNGPRNCCRSTARVDVVRSTATAAS